MEEVNGGFVRDLLRRCKLDRLLGVEEPRVEVTVDAKLMIDWEKGGDQTLVWEETHSMFDDPKISCPICDATCQKTMIGVQVHGYVRGDGYLDKQGATRDMNLYKLLKDDPYGHMRQPGEKEDLAQRLRNAGKKGFDKHGHKKGGYFGFGKGSTGGGKIT